MKNNTLKVLSWAVLACAAPYSVPLFAAGNPAMAGTGDTTITEEQFLKAAKESFPWATPAEFDERVKNDVTLAICNKTNGQPNAAETDVILKFEQSRMEYPKDGKRYGDWKKGQEWAEGAHGGRIGFADADDPAHPNGANCYACHAIDLNFPAAGNMGPSLTNYGKLRGQSEPMIKYTYEKVFNAKALVPCSLMPRYGGKGHLLTAEQVADITAFLLDPASPVNLPPKAAAQ
ncbi:MAG: sulfur oxidation c-type cytochrome SoxX [Halothiobacillus sp. 24-54-40]|jgi:sulfur-oxidizing protein SoxX|nr:sulfur oxidation c-type cytochrome SoxX [Halothiobacillaceae bacterium]OYV47590.1 MAG: sulfur oxidation c-type cytochrome SoxX [Halothiobacillus sp. 20-53-49]OYY36733.1 MAG: sulfur oxidation c-type cytochrome SoxX [Halothiobacillus sp. 35-54-62]OYZ86188.1 MAG: sulfur oxidation c-type cytochrome SoxX [Halothiobacillus sp. 24-54-40]OZA79757.1 MAG: sulfur oxidation c-type cytochrome SoxX [Halothiobacillus sp. 39-53-45]HQS02693.1 sulfur oxidation c-type cytochrome SoxX [Halothiobacillus sp.]